MNTDILPKIFTSLNMALFERLEDNRFKPVCDIPAWFNSVYAMPNSGTMDLARASPFLENFLIDALPTWNNKKSVKIASGVWTETDNNHQQYQLEAYAIHQSGMNILVLADLTDSFQDRHHVYQRAREIALENEKLVLGLKHHQRELQATLEEKLELKYSLDMISNSVDNNTSAVLICEKNGQVEVINRALVDIYHFNPKHPGENHSMLKQWLKEAEGIYPEMQRVIASGAYWEGEFESRDIQGIKKWIRLAVGPVLDDHGAISHYVCIANDISEIRKSSRELEKLTDYDLTTHLPNRHNFWKRITRTIDDSLADHTSFALFYIDLDHFKRINESLGHHAGDFMLSTLASRLSNHIKRRDFIAHLGGDEFAVIANLDSLEEIQGMATRLLAEINYPINLDNTQLKISASIGIALFPKDGHDATTLMKHADLAMFHAKELGRNQHQLFNININKRFISRLNIQNDLTDAIDKNQFKLLYQPQISLTKGPEFRIEALIRWHHPEKGLISPASFIPLAEESGQIHEIGRWVLETACQQAVELRKQGYDVNVGVNVSACQARKEGFIDIVESALSQAGLPPSQLEVEITETSLLQEMDTVITMLSKLRREGITVSLDDFGSGFSSLNYLKSLPVDNIKIDQSFVKELPKNEESKAITSSIIRLAHELRMNVIAEGVETIDQLDFLKSQGCDFVQGYLFYRPIDSNQLSQVFEELALVS